MTNKLDSNNVPKELVKLIYMAEKWGIGDDISRNEAVEIATKDQLEELTSCLEIIDDDVLFDWLSGPESYDKNPSKEYIAFTCLTMAIDYAKLKLKKISN
jgi:hypothetical protein